MLCKFENGRCTYHFYNTESECRAVHESQRLADMAPQFLSLLHECITYLESPDQEHFVGRDRLLGRLRGAYHQTPGAMVQCKECHRIVMSTKAERVVGGYLCHDHS